MVRKLSCDCDERVGITIDSIKLFEELKTFFEVQVKNGVFVEEENKEPFYSWKDGHEEMDWYATK